jgi:CDP-paratose 2-epimerase
MADWRPGDQKVFVSDIRRAQAELGWAPRISSSRGLDLLYDWIAANQPMFEQLFGAPSAVHQDA